MRFLTAYFATKEDSEITLTGSQRMQERPIKILVDALVSLGANITYLKEVGFPPILIKGKKITNNLVTLNADVSSQYISALMLIAPSLLNGLIINLKGEVTSVPYINMTISLLKKAGISGSFNSNKIEIKPSKVINDVSLNVESDWSSASYYYSLVALSDKMTITLKNYSENSLQGDSELVSIYKKMGVSTVFNTSKNTIQLKKITDSISKKIYLNLNKTPDIAQTIAVTCFGLGLYCKLEGLKTLKIKETDRLVALKYELEKLGASVKITDDSLELFSSTIIHNNCIIETYQDHRMAMAFTPLALKTPLVINHPEVVTKSYASFWKDIQKAGIQAKIK